MRIKSDAPPVSVSELGPAELSADPLEFYRERLPMATPADIDTMEKEAAGEMPKVSVMMIVRDEEKNISEAIKSALMIGDEVVIVDTGSVDKTVSIIGEHQQRHPGRIISGHFTWVNSFAAARNFAASLCLHPWIMWMDADDRIEEKSARLIRGIFKDPNAGPENIFHSLTGKRPAYAFMVRCPGAVDGAEKSLTFSQVRLYPNGVGLTWNDSVGGIHESLSDAIDEKGIRVIAADNIFIDHTGYIDPDDIKRKAARNMAEVAKAPPGYRRTIEMARSMMQAGDYCGAMLELKGSDPSLDEMRYLRGACLYSMGDFDGAANEFVAVKDRRDEAQYYFALCLGQGLDADILSEARELAEYLDRKPNPMQFYGTEAGEMRLSALQNLIRLHSSLAGLYSEMLKKEYPHARSDNSV